MDSSCGGPKLSSVDRCFSKDDDCEKRLGIGTWYRLELGWNNQTPAVASTTQCTDFITAISASYISAYGGLTESSKSLFWYV